MDWHEIGRNIRRKREERKWTQEHLAEKVGVATGYIGMIERGKKMPKLETFVRIANALEASSDELLSGVIAVSYKVRMSKYLEKIGGISGEKQKMVYDIIDVVLGSGK